MEFSLSWRKPAIRLTWIAKFTVVDVLRFQASIITTVPETGIVTESVADSMVSVGWSSTRWERALK